MLLDLSLPARPGLQCHQAGFAVDLKRVTVGEDRKLSTPRVDRMIMPLTSTFGATTPAEQSLRLSERRAFRGYTLNYELRSLTTSS